ncbi:MAG: putative toxin-antitoxin system toxin component, PIN family [Candidatus Levybacteria bacterium RIFCSPLOWO2_02_FULL_37_10]|nr:MAG: putative toxin-antitoxin system toxin component, PIN family [Candidatus Levybacteria bacterium RIFCSPHIGHO2_01_FULL_37_33]OGH17193.1 MAG: putative toxin-antitoxin system toxin component, PIN family [Candidatus Levybacteria bacterium RIFCSPHIGHO2_02_FULL_37_11]OGH29550.1 MAG: putative toxin-antitoxin system toxin component, PIN family [Candidatus Levybacteria bacterium RIFCSPHIGHO2_12_FULL_37_12]OGH43143.1 MAG: putative toxin-antitoxin system toxin component, PIN family [Candidatus Levyba
MVVSKPLLVELFEVLKRPEIHSKFASSVSIDYKQLLDFLSQAEVVEIGDIPNISRDIKDNKFLETAIAARADYLVSEDKDLLILGKYRGTQILTCRGFADILESQGR